MCSSPCKPPLLPGQQSPANKCQQAQISRIPHAYSVYHDSCFGPFRVGQYFLRHFMWAGAFYGIPCGPVLSTAMLWANTHAARFMRSCIGLNRSSTHTHARTHASTHAHTHARTLTATHSQLYPPTPTQTQHKHHAYQACEAFIHTSCSFKHHAYQACEAFIHTSCSFTHHAYQACEAFRPQHLEPNGIMH